MNFSVMVKIAMLLEPDGWVGPETVALIVNKLAAT